MKHSTKSAVVMLAFAATSALPAYAEADVATSSLDTNGPTASPSAVDILGTASLPVDQVRIENGNIFNLDDPAEDKLLYRFANRLHTKTRRNVIQAQLLFEPGETATAQQIEESERLLRANRYLQDARITPQIGEDGRVDISVATTDVWTLIPKISFSRSGGENESGIGIKEMNLLGSGMSVELQYRSEVDRDSVALKFSDQNLGGSRYAINTTISRNSDGHQNYFDLGKPFYALDARESGGFIVNEFDRVESYYVDGDELADFRHEAMEGEIYLGWSKGLHDGWAKRLTAGFTVDDHRFSDALATDLPGTVVPPGRKFVYPWVGMEWVEDRFEKTTNQNQINQTEDRFLGTRLSARVGLASQALGSNNEALMFNTSAQKGFGSSEDHSLIIGADLAGRVEDGRAANLLLDMRADYFRRQSEHRLLYVGLQASVGDTLDADQQLLLGGETGLRGYPLRYQAGSRKALLSVEQRYFSDWYPFRLFHVGGAVFFDIGRAWGETPVSDGDNPWLRDLGVGLRIGNSRSGHGRMTHIDLAYPMDGNDAISNLQLLVSTKKSF